MKIVFDIDKYKRALEKTPLKMLNYQLLIYLCLRITFNEKIPPLEQIAKDLKLDPKTVKEAITDLEDYGVLEVSHDIPNLREKINYTQLATFKEADWRRRQIKLLKEQFKKYREVVAVFLYNFKSTHKGKLNSVEMDFMTTAYLVHRTFLKARTQYGLAINVGDREACQQAHHFIKSLTDWLSLYDPKINLMVEILPIIKDMVTNPQLIYYENIKK